MKKLFSAVLTIAMTCSVWGLVLASGEAGPSGPSIGSSTALNGVMSAILGVVQAVGIAFASGMLLYVGIKYVMASANEKADLKKGSISYVIGAVIIFGASALLGVFQSLADEVGSAG